MRIFAGASIITLGLALCGAVAAQDLPESGVSELPAGRSLRLPITRDVWFSAVGDEADGNTGGAARLKLKAIQEMSLVDIDPAPLFGRVVRSATLWLHPSSQERLGRVTVGSFASPWIEGTGRSYEPQPGSSTFSHRLHPDMPWAWPGSDLTAVVLGQSGTVWRFADALPADSRGYQAIPVDPRVIAARVAGVSEGLFLFDDTGSEWTREGDAFHFRLFPNRFVFSREEGAARAPYLVVELGDEDRLPPAAPRDLQLVPRERPSAPGEFRRWLRAEALEWTGPEDAGPAGCCGYFVKIDGQALPQYLVPRADAPGRRVSMPLDGLRLTAGKTTAVEVAAVDGAGNRGPAASLEFVAPNLADEPLPGTSPAPFRDTAPLPALGDARVAIVDALDKVHPLTGATIPPQPAEYLAANHLWSARQRLVRLAAARNECVAMQVVVEGPWRNASARLTLDDPRISVEWGHLAAVGTQAGPLPDPVVPWDGAAAIPAGPDRTALLCEVTVPHQVKPGLHTGRLELEGNGQQLALVVKLMVWDFTLPDRLSFLPEMNCYGLPRNERDYYRLAHRHRTVLNRVPYSHRGVVDDGCAPAWDGKQLDWHDWDTRFGPLLDGSAFADLPRAAVPVECFYLPLHENWPAPMEGNYNGSYWADQAFPKSYRETFAEVVRQMTEHFRERGWNSTLFQFYLNNKNNYKQAGWSRATSPWLLDEPASYQDYWALRYFGEAFHAGVNRALGTDRGPDAPRMLFRCDISRPEWQRDALDHVLDYNVVGGGALRRYHPTVIERKQRTGQIVVDYGSTNPLESSNVQPVGWCLDSWCRGSDGVVPWQTIGTAQSWNEADPLSLFYPGEGARLEQPVPSIRLKAYRRGQQDTEYLTLACQALGRTRGEIGRAVLEMLHLRPQRAGTGFTGGEDAGMVTFADLHPQELWALRIRLAQIVAASHVPAEKEWVDWHTPVRDPTSGCEAWAHGATPLPGARWAVDAAADGEELAGREPSLVVQGKPAVADALIDFDLPTQPLGATPRDNRLKRGETCSALLLRFDLSGAPAGAKLARAELAFSVWDPSSQGRTHVKAMPLHTAWDEATATWRQPAAGRSWQGGERFDVARDTAGDGPDLIVLPDAGSDLADPPVRYRLDVTEIVRGWLSGKQENLGLALTPVVDRSVDDGHHTRMQILCSEYPLREQTPCLILFFRP